WQAIFTKYKHRAQVYTKHLVPIFNRQVDNFFERHHCRVVDKHIHAAIFINHSLYTLLDLRGNANIDLEWNCLPAGFVYQISSLAGGFYIAVDNNYRPALGAKSHACCLPDARAATGYQAYLICKSHTSIIFDNNLKKRNQFEKILRIHT